VQIHGDAAGSNFYPDWREVSAVKIGKRKAVGKYKTEVGEEK